MQRFGLAQSSYTFPWITDARPATSSKTAEKIKIAGGIRQGSGIACLGGHDISSQGKRTGRDAGESRANYGQICIDTSGGLFHNVLLS
jgi:hypothetical protein